MIHIYFFPPELDIISRRITVKHTAGLIRPEVIETVTVFNDGNSPITEIALELEEFRNDLSIFDEKGDVIPFLTKEAIKR